MSCNVIFAGEGKGYLSAIIAIDDSLDPRNGLYALDENPKRLVTLNVAGSIELRKVKMSRCTSKLQHRHPGTFLLKQAFQWC